MQTPKRTLYPLLVAVVLVLGTLGPLASAALAAGPGPSAAVSETGPWSPWLSGLAERLKSLALRLEGAVGQEPPTALTSQHGAIADPNGEPATAETDSDDPEVMPQHGPIADPDG